MPTDLWHVWYCRFCDWWNTNHAPECASCHVARAHADDHAPAQRVKRLRNQLAKAERHLRDAH